MIIIRFLILVKVVKVTRNFKRAMRLIVGLNKGNFFLKDFFKNIVGHD